MDVVVTIPKDLWGEWLNEGDLAEEGRFSPSPPVEWEGRNEYGLLVGHVPSNLRVGDRVYIVALGLVRGYSPLHSIESYPACRRFGALRPTQNALVRRGDAVAMTVKGPDGLLKVKGFQGCRYRWWDRDDEIGFPDWRTRR
jgi:hypothetical protein